jgi:hypothetical protein
VIAFLSGLPTSSISALLFMFPDTVPFPIGFSETAQSLEQKFRVYRVIRGSISSSRLNLSFPRFSSKIAFVHGSIQFTAPFSHRKPFIPLCGNSTTRLCSSAPHSHRANDAPYQSQHLQQR